MLDEVDIILHILEQCLRSCAGIVGKARSARLARRAGADSGSSRDLQKAS